MQNRIDRLILNGNNEFSENRNVIAALVEYSRCLDLFDFLDRSYKIQLHELLVRVAICYDILGNFTKTLEYLVKALSIVPNVSSLVLYKSVLLQTLGKTEEAQKTLVKYKQISKNKLDLYETFRLVFYYSMKLEKEVLLREINEYFEKYPKNAVVLYLRAMIYLEMSKEAGQFNPTLINTTNPNLRVNNNSEYFSKYEKDIGEAMGIEPHDTEFLMKDGITHENLTKLFFMILPDMDFYQPKPLVNYKTFQSGLKVVYVIIKAVKMFKIKLEKKKLKLFYSNKLKQYKKRIENSKLESDTSNCNNHSTNSYIHNRSDADKTHNDASAVSGKSGTATNTGKESLITNNNTSDFEIKEGENITQVTQVTQVTQITQMISSKLNSNGLLKKNSKSVVTTERILKKNPTIVNIKNNVEKANANDIINEIKKEYEIKVKNLYKSAWLYNLRLCDNLALYNLDIEVDTNYFIKHKFYAPFNLSETIINGIKQNTEFKNERTTANNVLTCNNVINNPNSKMLSPEKQSERVNYKIGSSYFNSRGSLQTKRDKPTAHAKNEDANFSVSEINHINRQAEEDSFSINGEIKLLDNPTRTKSNSIHNLKKIEIDKLKLQKATSEVLKSDLVNKKYIHKPSPRTNAFKFNIQIQKFPAFSKERKLDMDFTKNNDNSANENIKVANNSNSNNLSNTSVNRQDQENNINDKKDGQISLRKSSENKQNKIKSSLSDNKPEIKQESKLEIGAVKPVLFRNITKNLNSKLTNIIATNTKFKRSESSKSGTNLKTNEK